MSFDEAGGRLVGFRVTRDVPLQEVERLGSLGLVLWPGNTILTIITRIIKKCVLRSMALIFSVLKKIKDH